MKTARKVISFLLVLSLTGCTTVPLTGRKRISFIPASQMAAMSSRSYDELVSGSRLSQDREETELIRRVGRNIASAAEDFLRKRGMAKELSNYNWEFNLIDNDKVVNAFCMPGGKIAFYTGILELADSEEYVAVVMGHEVAHAVAQHGNERMSQMLLVQLGGMALSKAMEDKPEETRKAFLAAFGIGSQVGILLPYSRKHEYEADEIGAVLMAKAGYRPEAAAEFWRKMDEKRGANVPEFISTHPDSRSRIDNLIRYMPEARKYYSGR